MKKKETCSRAKCADRLGKVGGQAVLEGVMMKAGGKTVTTCRQEDGTLVVSDNAFVSIKEKHKWLNIPILRGVINFIEMLILSFKTLSISADALGIEEEDGKAEQWMKKHLGIRLTTFIMIIASILAVVLAVGLFFYLPNLISWLIDTYIAGGQLGVFAAIIEGVVKMAIFVLYLALVSLMPEIKRTFMYHGAEHKSIACFESGEELTPENAKKHTRFHPRCGTSFMFFMMLLGILAGMLIKYLLPESTSFIYTLLYTLIRLAILPLVVGIGYEFIMFAGKHDNIVTRILSAPGLWVQRITTKEPTEDMLEVAIISLKCAMRDEVPEFMEFYNARSWEKKTEGGTEAAEGEAEAVTEGEALAEAEAVPTEEAASESYAQDASEPTDERTGEGENEA